MRQFAARIALGCLVAACLFGREVGATYTFVYVDFPGAVLTNLRHSNDNGRIVGFASFDGVTNFSFDYYAGAFTPLPLPPGGFELRAHGINESGVIVGTTGETDNRAFILEGGAYTFLARPGWRHNVFRSINDNGKISGYSHNGIRAVGASVGFIFDRATQTYTDIDIPDSVETIAQGVNNVGQVVGSIRGLPGVSAAGFLREPDGTITQFRVQPGTFARDINDNGVITGFANPTGTLNGDHGWVGTSGGFMDLEVAGSVATVPVGINNLGQVSGYWVESPARQRGFIAYPASLPTGTTAGGAYVFDVSVVPNVPIFIDPPVALGYRYAIGKGNPRVAVVRFPAGIGDSRYKLIIKGKRFDVGGEEPFDFRVHGFPRGVKSFSVGCIEATAMLDPANAGAFPTGLTFVAAGRFTGTQKPLTTDPARGRCASGSQRDDDDDDDDDDDH